MRNQNNKNTSELSYRLSNREINVYFYEHSFRILSILQLYFLLRNLLLVEINLRCEMIE